MAPTVRTYTYAEGERADALPPVAARPRRGTGEPGTTQELPAYVPPKSDFWDTLKKIGMACGAIASIGAVIVGLWWVLSPRVATAYCSTQRCEDLARVDGALASQVTAQVAEVRKTVTDVDARCVTFKSSIDLQISQHETAQQKAEGDLSERMARIEGALRFLVQRQGGTYDAPRHP